MKMAITPTDIKLLPVQVKMEAYDLCLDCMDPDRRKNDSEQRRALVHDFDDGLTVNWAEDYPGGVTVNGLKQINLFDTGAHEGALALGKSCMVNGSGIVFQNFRYLLFGTKVIITGDFVFNGGVEIGDCDVKGSIQQLEKEVADLHKKDQELLQEISKLRKAIGKLNKKVGIA
jgi:hypothetical protein